MANWTERVSIYRFVEKKLWTHGVRNSADGRLTISDKDLFLLFVRLERALRLEDFEAVQAAVAAIENRASSLGKRHIVLFAYLYLKFSDLTPRETYLDIALEGEGVRRTVDYRRQVSRAERLIGDWATDAYSRLHRSFNRALHSDHG